MTEKMPMPPTRSEIPAIEARTMFQLTISLSISLRTRRISWPMFSILKSVIPRWLRRMRASASFCASPIFSGSALKAQAWTVSVPTKYFWAVVSGM